jgi:hypothetical protein
MNWATFEQQLAQKLQERADVSEEPSSPDIELIKTATIITDLYHQVAIASVEGTLITFKRPLTPIGTGLLSGAKIGIQAAIFSALKTMQLTNIKPNMVLMSPIGAAVVAYWGAVAVPGSISPFPMPAQYAYIGLVPGTPPFPLPTPWTGMRPL